MRPYWCAHPYPYPWEAAYIDAGGLINDEILRSVLEALSPLVGRRAMRRPPLLLLFEFSRREIPLGPLHYQGHLDSIVMDFMLKLKLFC